MNIEKFDRVIGTGVDEIDAIADACKHDKILAEEVRNLVINLGYTIEKNDTQPTPSQVAIAQLMKVFK